MTTRLANIIILTISLGLLLSCGSYDMAGTGSMSAQLVFPEDSIYETAQPLAATADCGAINTILVYAERSGGVEASAAFACTAGEGTLDGIPAGSQYRARIEAVKDGITVYRGTKPAIRIQTAQSTDAGLIPMIRTKPGTCVFIDSGLPLGGGAVSGIAMRDIDDDGDYDAVLSNTGTENKILIGSSSGLTATARIIGQDRGEAARYPASPQASHQANLQVGPFFGCLNIYLNICI